MQKRVAVLIGAWLLVVVAAPTIGCSNGLRHPDGTQCDFCKGDFCSAAGIWCNDVCRMPTEDVDNCGACGTTCSGSDTCFNGTCVTVLASGQNGPAALAVGAHALYWTTSEGSLWMVDLPNGQPVQLSQGTGGNYSASPGLVLSADRALWLHFNQDTNSAFTWWCPGLGILGGTCAENVPGSCDGGATWFCDGGSVNPGVGQLLSMQVDGGAVGALLSEAGMQPTGVASDGLNVYVSLTDGTLAAVPVDGGSVRVLSVDGATSWNYENHLLACDAGLLWLEGPQNEVLFLPTGSTTPEPRLSTSGGRVSSLASDGVNVYGGFSGPPIVSAPLAGGETAFIGPDAGRAFAVATDGTSVFWLGQTTVNETAIDGGATRVLFTGVTAPMQIAVDSQYVYWTDQFTFGGGSSNFGAVEGGLVLRVSK